MDGRLAILFWLMSLPSGEIQSDGFNVQRADTENRMVFAAGAVQNLGQTIGQEIHFTRMFGQKWDRFNPILDVSMTDQGGYWIGAGLYQQFNVSFAGQELFAGLTFAPGLYMAGDEIDLGLPLEFRSGAEVGVRLDNDWQVSLSYDHRSNADISNINPGVETLELRVSRTFN